jgi:hypothetical protein
VFEQTSRYYKLNNLKYTQTNRKNNSTHEVEIIVYKERRFLPQAREITTMQYLVVGPGERLDNLTFRSIGDPEQFSHICDANEAMHPLEMTSQPGKVLRLGIHRNVT